MIHLVEVVVAAADAFADVAVTVDSALACACVLVKGVSLAFVVDAAADVIGAALHLLVVGLVVVVAAFVCFLQLENSDFEPVVMLIGCMNPIALFFRKTQK